MILNRKNFIEASQIVKLMNATFINLSGELFAAHLIPEES